VSRWIPLLCLWLPGVPACARAQTVTAPPTSQAGKPAELSIVSVRADRPRVSQYGRVDLAVDLRSSAANPFDPAEIELDGLVTTPSGHRLVVPGFYSQEFTRRLESGQERLTARGQPAWHLRFCAAEVGRYRVTAVARSHGRQVSSRPVPFTCLPSRDAGFVRRSVRSPAYFAFDNGTAYLPVGANICWGNGPGTFSYDRWLARYGNASCNYGRLWLGPTWTTFALDRQGVGKIDLANAWRLDYVLQLAEKHGLYLMLCLDSYNELRLAKDGASPFWEQTPQNAANGGPLRQPGEFWDNPEMDRLYRSKLRYLVARYGAYTHVMAWEFWNEVDIVSASAWDEDRVRAWHERMARQLRGLDPYHHLITTSFSGSAGKPSIDRLPELDFVQTHTYGARDLPAEILSRQQQKAAYGKPHYVGECGIGDRQNADKSGIGLHNALWSGLFSGGAGTGMLWWWDNYIDPNNLYYHFSALGRFLSDTDPIRSDLRADSLPPLRYAAAPNPPLLTDIELPAHDRSWEACAANRPTQVWVTGPGDVKVDAALSGLLHGVKNHPDLHNPVTFHVDLPRPTRLVVQVDGVSGYGGARLTVRRNSGLVLDKPMTGPGGSEKVDTLHQFDGAYTVLIPPGPQTLQVENSGVDWMYVGYELKQARVAWEPPLRALALKGPDAALVWVQNLAHEWYPVLVQKQAPRPVPPTLLDLPGLTEGQYEVTLWDTERGIVSRRAQIRTANGRLLVPLPEVRTDVAIKVVRAE
jgi:hypothetical protein